MMVVFDCAVEWQVKPLEQEVDRTSAFYSGQDTV